MCVCVCVCQYLSRTLSRVCVCVCEYLSRTLRVEVFGQFERVGVGQVRVGRGDGQDEAALSGNELHDHFSDLLLDVHRLVAHRHFSDARQVDERQIQHCTGEEDRRSDEES